LLRRGIGLLLGHPCARVSAVPALLMAVLRVPAILVVLLLVSLLVSLLSICGVRVEALALLGLPRLLLLLLRTRDKGLLARSELECARVEAGRAGHAGGVMCVV
jgi:hypothetical protein